jgi:hypothetical protein
MHELCRKHEFDKSIVQPSYQVGIGLEGAKFKQRGSSGYGGSVKKSKLIDPMGDRKEIDLGYHQ